jgi:glutathione peroxidase-family protein
LQLIEFATRKIPLTAEIRVGTPAPDFELPDLHGRSVFLSQFRGQSHVVLMFGSITCCATVTQLRAGKPTNRSLYTRYRKKGFEFFLVYSRETHPGESGSAEARNKLVRFCYSERIVGLLRNRKISAEVHRRSGPQAIRDFARLLEEEGKAR